MGVYAVPDAETLKFSINLNRVLHIYLVSKRIFFMDYAIELLRTERDKLQEELSIAKTGSEKEWNWEVIIRNERLLEDLNKAIDLLWMAN